MSAFVVKLIALTTMVIDHTGAVFDTPDWFRWIGRIAFPIYVYLIAEGARKTQNMPKYLFRLGLFAVLSEIPFDLAFHAGKAQIASSGIWSLFDFMSGTNVFYTLFLGAFVIYIIQLTRESGKLTRISVGVVAAVLAAFMAETIVTDYAGFGVIWIVVCYIPKSKWVRLGLVFGGITYFYLQLQTLFSALLSFAGGKTAQFEWEIDRYIRYLDFWLPMFLFALLALIPLALYNGKRGPRMKWAFYAAYPVHIAILVIIRQLIA